MSPIQSEIQKLTQTFDYEWFKKLRGEFEAHPLYNKGHDCIKDGWEDDPFWDDDDELIYPGYCNIIHVEFSEYSWAGYSNLGYDPDFYKPIQTKGKAIYSKVENLIEYIFHSREAGNTLSINDKDKIIKGCVRNISDSIDTLKDKTNDLDYHGILDELLKKIRKQLSIKYRPILLSMDALSNADTALRFDLKQDELAALLSILHRADIMNDEGRTTAHINFYQNHFAFKNQKKSGSFTLSKNIRKKISDVINNPSKAYLIEEMKERLISACDSLLGKE